MAGSELKPARCGCGGEAYAGEVHFWGRCYTVQCSECGIETEPQNTEAEAIQAWNRAMGERTAKAKVNFKDENFFFGWCECGQYQSSQHPYCPVCGCRLEWNHE